MAHGSPSNDDILIYGHFTFIAAYIHHDGHAKYIGTIFGSNPFRILDFPCHHFTYFIHVNIFHDLQRFIWFTYS